MISSSRDKIMHARATLDDGRVTISEAVRDHPHLQEGDKVELMIEAGGARTIEEMREGMIESLVQEDERIKRGEE